MVPRPDQPSLSCVWLTGERKKLTRTAVAAAFPSLLTVFGTAIVLPMLPMGRRHEGRDAQVGAPDFPPAGPP
jgi:hypothetical protein